MKLNGEKRIHLVNITETWDKGFAIGVLKEDFNF